MMKKQKKDIQIRDPYVHVEDSVYYLYGTTDVNCWKGESTGFDVYTSEDLENFKFHGKAFTPPENFWGTQNFWAPELHKYEERYYLFASFKSPERRRATVILASDSLLGPFLPWGDESITPPDWECLDGTLYVDDDGKPWVVFCHEWVQEGGGTVCARRLKEDLSGAEGDAVTLFSASDAVWSKKIRHSSGIEGYVTDGPFLHRMQNGSLLMLWSSHGPSGYAIGQAISTNGISGPWEQSTEPLFSGDGGHGMIFRDLSGILRLSIHSPNNTPDERPIFLPVEENGNNLQIKK